MSIQVDVAADIVQEVPLQLMSRKSKKMFKPLDLQVVKSLEDPIMKLSKEHYDIISSMGWSDKPDIIVSQEPVQKQACNALLNALKWKRFALIKDVTFKRKTVKELGGAAAAQKLELVKKGNLYCALIARTPESLEEDENWEDTVRWIEVPAHVAVQFHSAIRRSMQKRSDKDPDFVMPKQASDFLDDEVAFIDTTNYTYTVETSGMERVTSGKRQRKQKAAADEEDEDEDLDEGVATTSEVDGGGRDEGDADDDHGADEEADERGDNTRGGLVDDDDDDDDGDVAPAPAPAPTPAAPKKAPAKGSDGAAKRATPSKAASKGAVARASSGGATSSAAAPAASPGIASAQALVDSPEDAAALEAAMADEDAAPSASAPNQTPPNAAKRGTCSAPNAPQRAAKRARPETSHTVTFADRLEQSSEGCVDRATSSRGVAMTVVHDDDVMNDIVWTKAFEVPTDSNGTITGVFIAQARSMQVPVCVVQKPVPVGSPLERLGYHSFDVVYTGTRRS